MYTIMTTVQEKAVVVPLRMSLDLAEKLERATRVLGYRSRNQLMREALERQVDEIMKGKVVEVRDISVDSAKRKIDNYLSKNPGVHYVSELAEKLGMELKVAFSAVKKLTDEGTVKVKNK
jgi:ribosomal protein S25